MKKAVVSITIGDGTRQPWLAFLKQSWEAFCERHNYDLIIFQKPLDQSAIANNRSIAWQKLLAMSSAEVSGYDAAVWIDADIILSPWAPDPLMHHPLERVGMAMDSGSPLSEEASWFKQCFSEVLASSLGSTKSKPHERIDSYFHLWGFNSNTRPLFNSGVVAYSPSRHGSILRDVYHTWHDGGPGALYEMIPLNLVLQQEGLCHRLDKRFNLLFGVYYAVYLRQLRHLNHEGHQHIDLHGMHAFAKRLFKQSFFLHFAGAHGTMNQILSHGPLT